MNDKGLKDYDIRYSSSAIKFLKKLEKKASKKIYTGLQRLVSGAENVDVKKLKGHDVLYRLRIADYWVIYEVHHKEILIQVIKIGHRKDVYEK